MFGSSIIGVTDGGSRLLHVITADGSLWEFSRDTSQWTRLPSIPGYPVAVQPSSWTGLKEGYRR